MWSFFFAVPGISRNQVERVDRSCSLDWRWADVSQWGHRLIQAILIALPLGACTSGIIAQDQFWLDGTAGTGLEVETLAVFDKPWAMSFLPDGQALVTEKGGALWLVGVDGSPIGRIDGMPETTVDGQGGLGDVMPHPDFASNRLVYLSWVEHDSAGSGAVVGRAPLSQTASGGRLDGLERIWKQSPLIASNRHYSHRLAFDENKHLFITSGDRGQQSPAQDLSNNLGTIVRLEEDGTPVIDNPFAERGGAALQFYTVGHRNPLGIAVAPDGTLWAHEMGPKGGDELNRIEMGENYGWPLVSDGVNYSGEPIPDHEDGGEFRAPAISWVPSVSPAGLVIYDDDLFNSWQGEALMGALSGRALLRVGLEGDTASELERFQWGARIREVEQAPDGSLWVLEDGSGGRLLRLVPAD